MTHAYVGVRLHEHYYELEGGRATHRRQSGSAGGGSQPSTASQAPLRSIHFGASSGASTSKPNLRYSDAALLVTSS